MGVFKLAEEAQEQARAVLESDPNALREVWRVVRAVAVGQWVPGIDSPYQRGSWRSVPAGRYRILFRPLTIYEIDPGEERGILVASIVSIDEIARVVAID